MRLLVVDDDQVLAAGLHRMLTAAGYAVDCAVDCSAALELEAINTYDILVIEWNLPDKSGVWLCHHLRQQGRTFGVLLLTERTAVYERVMGLDAGADDYLGKPFHPDELKARLRALRRRAPITLRPTIAIGDLRVDTCSQRVYRADTRVQLTAKEYSLLEYLARHAGRVVTREELCEHIWDDNHDPSSHALEVHISQIRAKLGDVTPPMLIQTRRRVGYVIPTTDTCVLIP